VAAVGLDALTRPTAMLEDEYFARLSITGSRTMVAPLHALRSQAVVDALLHDCPDQWLELATECLPLIVDIDIERFLLAAFSRRPEHSLKLEEALRALTLRTWSHAGAVARAFIWEGLNRYEQANHAVLAAAVAEHGDGWWLWADANLASDSSATELVRKTLAKVMKRDESELPAVVLTDKTRAFEPFREWHYTCPLRSRTDFRCRLDATC